MGLGPAGFVAEKCAEHRFCSLFRTAVGTPFLRFRTFSNAHFTNSAPAGAAPLAPPCGGVADLRRRGKERRSRETKGTRRPCKKEAFIKRAMRRRSGGHLAGASLNASARSRTRLSCDFKRCISSRPQFSPPRKPPFRGYTLLSLTCGDFSPRLRANVRTVRCNVQTVARVSPPPRPASRRGAEGQNPPKVRCRIPKIVLDILRPLCYNIAQRASQTEAKKRSASRHIRKRGVFSFFGATPSGARASVLPRSVPRSLRRTLDKTGVLSTCLRFAQRSGKYKPTTKNRLITIIAVFCFGIKHTFYLTARRYL